MAENRVQYSARTYDDYRKSFLDITRKYYPDMAERFDDASVGQWFIELCASIGDELNYHIDRTYQETSVDAAGQRSSLLSIAKNNGVKVPGKKAAIVEVELSCELPLGAENNGNLREADESYAPYVKRGTLFSTGLVTFELVDDVDFSQQFDHNGVSNRQIIPNHDSNGNIVSYTYKKLGIAVAGQSKVYKKIITDSDIKPFMSVLIQDANILGVESIIVKQGADLSSSPLLSDYDIDMEEFKDKDGKPVKRYFEAENLIDQYRFGHETQEEGSGADIRYNPIWNDETTQFVIQKEEENGKITYKTVELEEPIVIRQVARGKWKRFKNKFVTEYTDNGSLKITFGSGINQQLGQIPEDARNFTKYMMSRMTANDYMGVLPDSGTTMFILYRVGGGEQSNIAKGSLTNITNLFVCIDGSDARKVRDVKSSISVTNTTPSYGGKDEPSDEELRQLIKYNAGAKNRCVTLHDYIARISEMPAKYGTPFRCGVIEENNKVVIYTLGLDSEGHLDSKLSEYVANNMKEYLSMYRMINDFVEIRSGKIINVSFEVDIYIEKSYEKAEVVKRVIELITDYMDVRKWLMGDEYCIGDLEKEISKLDGVKNLIELRVYNKVGVENGYSDDETTQELINYADCCYDEYVEGGQNYDNRIDLKASDKILFTEANSLIEVKYPNRDIKVNVRER